MMFFLGLFSYIFLIIDLEISQRLLLGRFSNIKSLLSPSFPIKLKLGISPQIFSEIYSEIIPRNFSRAFSPNFTEGFLCILQGFHQKYDHKQKYYRKFLQEFH